GYPATAWAGAAMLLVGIAAVALALRLGKGGGRSRVAARSAGRSPDLPEPQTAPASGTA
ncbi:Cmx/CmrA family chloramphenicol efflux MFS transporter, partial [Streptomyces sp. CAI-78]|nr:Cmx/CmrA family chloramphenicol efflux MFS transporter [Streptomyces sp. CAI-78]